MFDYINMAPYLSIVNKKLRHERDRMAKLLVILGQTASGKSELAVKLAKKLALSKIEGFNGAEIISADSRQVYRGMDIGTGKVPLKKCAHCQYQPYYKNTRSCKLVISEVNKPAGCYKGIPHYLLDVASPKKRFTVSQYKKLAQGAIKKILAKGKLPIICGGTGFYIQALTENLPIPAVEPDWKLRTKLEKISAKELYEKLQKLDPRRARNIDQFNKRRLIRALEIIYKTGKPVPVLKSPLTPPFGRLRAGSKGGKLLPPFREGWGGFNILYLGIKKSPAQLKKLIASRLKKRLRQGMIKEVKNLHQSGVSWRRLEEFGLEYRWLARYLQKKISRQAMLQRLQKDIEHFAKRQMTWFKRNKKIHWINNRKKVHTLTKDFLKK